MALQETATQLPKWSLGDRLRKARAHAGIDRDEMATRLGVTPGAVSHWEGDRSRPRDLLDVVNRWAQETGVPAAWLLGFSDSGYKQTALRPVADESTEPFQPSLHFESRPALSPVR